MDIWSVLEISNHRVGDGIAEPAHGSAIPQSLVAIAQSLRPSQRASRNAEAKVTFRSLSQY